MGPIVLLGGFPFPVVCYIGYCACKRSANFKIPKLASKGVCLKRLHWTPLFISLT